MVSDENKFFLKGAGVLVSWDIFVCLFGLGFGGGFSVGFLFGLVFGRVFVSFLFCWVFLSQAGDAKSLNSIWGH